jgi:hypothetical protein
MASMGRPTYADVKWLHWLSQIGAADALQQGSIPDSLHFCYRSEPNLYMRLIMDRCVLSPISCWPQLVDEECEKLLAAGVNQQTVKKIPAQTRSRIGFDPLRAVTGAHEMVPLWWSSDFSGLTDWP